MASGEKVPPKQRDARQNNEFAPRKVAAKGGKAGHPSRHSKDAGQAGQNIRQNTRNPGYQQDR